MYYCIAAKIWWISNLIWLNYSEIFCFKICNCCTLSNPPNITRLNRARRFLVKVSPGYMVNKKATQFTISHCKWNILDTCICSFCCKKCLTVEAIQIIVPEHKLRNYTSDLYNFSAILTTFSTLFNRFCLKFRQFFSVKLPVNKIYSVKNYKTFNIFHSLSRKSSKNTLTQGKF